MALLPVILEAAFAEMVVDNPATAQDAADAYAAAYQAYALTAMADVVPPIFIGTEALIFSGILYPVFKEPEAGTAELAAAAFVEAMTTFWMAPPILFGVGGFVTAFTGAAALQADLESLFSAPNDKLAFANGLATALDTATRTVVVSIPVDLLFNLA